MSVHVKQHMGLQRLQEVELWFSLPVAEGIVPTESEKKLKCEKKYLWCILLHLYYIY